MDDRNVQKTFTAALGHSLRYEDVPKDDLDALRARIEELERDLKSVLEREALLQAENERLRGLVFVGYHEGYTEAGGHWRGNSGWDDSETKFALDNPPARAAVQGEAPDAS
jgi:hypothetical protein